MQNKIEEIRNSAIAEIEKTFDLKTLEDVKNKYLSRNSEFNNLKKGMKDVHPCTAILKRYRELGERMILDIEGLEPKSLDHISSRMGDVAGRLDLGRANEKTVEIEDGIVKDLDEQIEKLEKQLEQMMKRQQQSSSPSQSPNPPQSGQPLGGPSGKGHVDRKDVGSGSGWGDLPEKEREKDLQQIQENFPPHYRDIIEQYFKRMSETEN